MRLREDAKGDRLISLMSGFVYLYIILNYLYHKFMKLPSNNTYFLGISVYS